jgi:hypothetical protein
LTPDLENEVGEETDGDELEAPEDEENRDRKE